MEVITKNAKETADLGKKIGSDLKGGEILALVGDLGAGKTTFIQGLAKGLNINQKIISPTFILMRKYNNFYHLDLYRLEDNLEEEIRNLGLTDIWEDKKNIIVIEWAEKIKDFLPSRTRWVNFESIGDNERKITSETLH